MPTRRTWPTLPLEAWRDTYATLHMWTQIIGKICLAGTPLANHFWNVAFRVTARGLVTPTIAIDGRMVTMTFDFIGHELVMEASDGAVERVELKPRTVADFYGAVLDALGRLDVAVPIWTMPVEVPNPIRFTDDTVHRHYDAPAVTTFLELLVAIVPVFESFRCRFIGKSSPVHFFWGSFDLAATRFSGRVAPERPGADAITREAYSHEVISHGFWPGSGAVQEPAFYAYAAPEPDGFRGVSAAPAGAFYSTDLSEFILPYEVVRTAPSPEDALTAFLESTYGAGAELAGWHRAALERRPAR